MGRPLAVVGKYTMWIRWSFVISSKGRVPRRGLFTRICRIVVSHSQQLPGFPGWTVHPGYPRLIGCGSYVL